MTEDDFTLRAPGTAALTAALLGFGVAANYLVPGFFALLEPWFWPALAAGATLAALFRLYYSARRGGEKRALGAAFQGLVFTGPVRSLLSAAAWAFWAAALFMSFRSGMAGRLWPAALFSLGPEAQGHLAGFSLTAPFILWPSLSAAVSLAALIESLRRRRFVIPLIALAVSLCFIAGDLYLRHVAERVHASSEEMLEDEIERMVEEARND